MSDYFNNIPKIEFEGQDSTNPLVLNSMMKIELF